METQAYFVGLQRWQPTPESENIHKTEGLRETEILLQNAVTGVGVLGIRQQGLFVAKTDRPQKRGRQSVNSVTHHQIDAFQIVVQPEKKGFGDMTLAAQIKAQAVHAQ